MPGSVLGNVQSSEQNTGKLSARGNYILAVHKKANEKTCRIIDDRMEKNQPGKGNRDCNWRIGGNLLFSKRQCSPSTSRPCLLCWHRPCFDAQEGHTGVALSPAAHTTLPSPDPQTRQVILPPSWRRPCWASQRNVSGAGGRTPHTRAGEQRTTPPRSPSPTPPDPTPTTVLTPYHDCSRGHRGLEELLHRGPEREI